MPPPGIWANRSIPWPPWTRASPCAAWAWTARSATYAAWRQPLGYLLVAVLASTLLVSMAKRASGIDCPWDLQRYGGTRPEGLWFAVLSA